MTRKRIDMKTLVKSAKDISSRFADSDIPHVVVGGVAVYLHGATRNDGDDIDFFVGKAKKAIAIELIEGMGFKRDGKYYKSDDIKVQIESNGFRSFPDPNNADEWVDIGGVRVPNIDKMIETKSEVCREILKKVLSDGIGGPRRRNAFIKHATDLTALVKGYGKKKRK